MTKLAKLEAAKAQAMQNTAASTAKLQELTIELKAQVADLTAKIDALCARLTPVVATPPVEPKAAPGKAKAKATE